VLARDVAALAAARLAAVLVLSRPPRFLRAERGPLSAYEEAMGRCATGDSS